MVFTNTSRALVLPRGIGRLRRVVVRGEVGVTVIDVVFWVALTAVAAGVILRARRRSARPALAGAGDDKPPGYENPTPDEIAMRESGPAS